MIEIFSIPGIGKVNEDYMCHEQLAPTVYAIVVADGMGGLDFAADAARIASEGVISYLKHHYKSGTEFQVISDSLIYANDAITAECMRRKAKMGAAIAVAIMSGCSIYYSWLGDVRIYRRHGECVELITEDHVFDKDHHTYLIRCLNGKPLRYSPEVNAGILQPGDVVVIATDGYYLENPALIRNAEMEYSDDATLVSFTV